MRNQAKSLMCLIGLIAICGSLPVSGARAGFCKEFAKTSFSATRTLTVGGKKTITQVYIKPGFEREESRHADKLVVRIFTPEFVYIFDPEDKTGVKFPAPPTPGKKPPKDPNVVIIKDLKGDVHTTKISRKAGKKNVPMMTIVCRTDGVLLGRTFLMPVSPREMATAVLIHSDVKVGQLDDGLFTPPGEVKFKAPPKRRH